ncbi:MAG: phosphoribosylformylglycinamidine cyclo-ligase [Candidatus Izemoplasmatales bacterium]|jgi:phosphoribosylformylglycinamidine cyclo-ligase|nr:phosphoribosylformylglycinamidine cyclo-ligase [Candidatus Izemoplasmatales bacterium]MDD4595769.1 phosphoribosylformylglycinamidine cyclo-ligase [Candidatus Izemoplasmatales bacterium]
MSKIYEQAGVGLERGYEVIRRIKKYTKSTFREGVIGDIGAFGGLFSLKALNLSDPVLVSGTDGVGTKLLLARDYNRHDTVGIDLVAMSVNDVITSGAEPLFFLDYIAVGETNPDHIESIIKGIHDGCIDSHCALIGGETAEMPDLYHDGHYDLAGFCVGIAERTNLITGDDVKCGDAIIALPSNGIHSNGYSLVRKIISSHPDVDLCQFDEALNEKPIDALMKPTKIYVKPILALLKQVKVKGIAHITGGGFDENIPRILKADQGVTIDTTRIALPLIFPWLQRLGNLPKREMYQVFNMGVGMIVVVRQSDVLTTLKILKEMGEDARVIGEVTNSLGVEITW